MRDSNPVPEAGRGPDRTIGRRRLPRSAVCLGLVGVICASAANVEATTIGGGGNGKVDCLSVFETPIVLPPKKRTIRCTDGDIACDADATINGKCSFQVAVCGNSGAFPETCSAVGLESIFVEHAADNGDPEFDPDFQALQDRIESEFELPGTDESCTGPVNISVTVQGPLPGNRCRAGRKKLQLKAYSQFDPSAGRSFVDKDALRFVCKPAATGCDPRLLFGGTFERIRRQILNPSCATGGCHDSESMAGGLLLELGPDNPGPLLNTTPVNSAAQALGWALVRPGEPASSFLYQKIEGQLDSDDLGEQMPRHRRKLKRFLREIVRLWIKDDAPGSGWVAGTD